ncbi:hypothetical protein BKM31_25945 [[Actinomadura] parvosata subsp. kistnae]|uniref:Uncharacterized protein n=1 Tax=[Actinomadura] parvosata subsp. kistnae TaxID=1909395 RepID=A0A1V0A2M6_9ACTN|nr:hypothetical protein BKM31_25945 [Nonomuraea sp. ATCC 55076]
MGPWVLSWPPLWGSFVWPGGLWSVSFAVGDVVGATGVVLGAGVGEGLVAGLVVGVVAGLEGRIVPEGVMAPAGLVLVRTGVGVAGAERRVFGVVVRRRRAVGGRVVGSWEEGGAVADAEGASSPPGRLTASSRVPLNVPPIRTAAQASVKVPPRAATIISTRLRRPFWSASTAVPLVRCAPLTGQHRRDSGSPTWPMWRFVRTTVINSDCHQPGHREVSTCAAARASRGSARARRPGHGGVSTCVAVRV